MVGTPVDDLIPTSFGSGSVSISLNARLSMFADFSKKYERSGMRDGGSGASNDESIGECE